MTRIIQPIHRIRQALDALAYWTPLPARRVPNLPALSPLEQMYAYWDKV